MPENPKSFVSIDVETTGVDRETDSIIQVGAVLFEDGEPVRKLDRLVRPAAPIPLRIQRMTGISQDEAAGAPVFGEIAPLLLEFVGEMPLVAHNAQFDLEFLGAEMERCGMAPLPNRSYDTLDLARVVRPSCRSYRLERLASDCAIALDRAHNALSDATATGRLFVFLYESLCSMDPHLLDYLASLAGFCGWNLIDLFRAAGAMAVARRMAGEALGQASPGPAAETRARAARAVAGLARGEEGTGEEYLPVEPQSIKDILGRGGRLSNCLESYEFRQEQLQMAYLVGEALSDGKHLMVEAGTGIGKSIAYLVPAALFASANRSRVVISTHTINLQEQLCEKDIPLIRERLDIDIQHALLKGRSNYLCLRRWRGLSARAATRSPDEIKLIARMAVWLNETSSGDRSELGLGYDQEALWEAVASDGESCEGQACPHFGSCYFQAARAAAARANIVVVNHSLVLSDAATGNRVLPEYSHVIFDEAHHIERAASEHFGVSLSTAQMERLLGFSQRGGLADRLGTVLGESAEADVRAATSSALACRDLIQAVLKSAAKGLGAAPGLVEAAEQPLQTVRLRDPDLDDTHLAGFRVLLEKLSQEAASAASALASAASGIEDCQWDQEVEPDDVRDLGLEVRKVCSGLQEASRVLASVASSSDPEMVFWLEVEKGARPRVTFRIAPVNPGSMLRERLFDRARSAVLTSATLTVDGRFDYAMSRAGFDEGDRDRLIVESIGSPFDYATQALVCVPSGLPSPREGEVEFRQALGRSLVRLAEVTRGRTLVLFTSNRMLRSVYHNIKGTVESLGVCLLAQGIDGSRTRLVEELRDDAGTMVFGSQSFWEGIDVAGPALSCVAIVKLPFSRPNDPVVEARMERLQAAGVNPFTAYLVPDAVLKFKQGFGRLIRSRADRGIVMVFDRRVLPGCSGYGARFLDSLPGPSVASGDEDELFERMQEWLPQPGR